MKTKDKKLTKNAMAHLLRSAASALDHGRMATAVSKVNEVYDALRPSHTPHGNDPRWVEAINGVLSDRGSDVQITEVEQDIWDRFIGPMCDELMGEGSDNPHDRDEHDASCNGMSPCDMVTEDEDDD